MSEPHNRPGLVGVPCVESSVSFLDGQRSRLEYRGIPVEILARESCYEETAWLLLRGELPTQRQLADFDDQLRHKRRLKYRMIDLLKCLPENAHPGEVLQAAVAALGVCDSLTNRFDSGLKGDAITGIIARVPTLLAAYQRLRRGDEPLAPRDDLGHAGNFYWMLFEREPSPAQARVLDACLILHADPAMDVATFSARLTGSTLSSPYAVVSAAIGALIGPAIGSTQESALRMIQEIGSIDQVPAWLHDAVANEKKIVGFGHPVFNAKDPRVTVLQELAENMFAESTRPALYDLAVALEKEAGSLLGSKGIYPNLDYYSGIVCQSLGFPTDLLTPFLACARVAGWMAHWLEQLQNHGPFCPEQVFVGKHDIAYVPLEQRP
jgi:citrate synthase